MDFTEVLSAHRFTRGLSARSLANLAAIAEIVAFSENQVVLKTREKAAHLYLLLSGSMSVEVANPVCTVRIAVIAEGDAFSWSALLAERETLFQVRAREDSTALRLDGRQLMDQCSQDHELCFKLLGQRFPELMASRLQAAETKLLEFWGTGQ